MLTVLGGKITTFRKLAEQAVDWIAPLLGRHAGAWTAHACLPGGDLFGPQPNALAVTGFAQWMTDQQARYPWLPPAVLARYAHAYGTRLALLIDGRKGLAEMGEQFAPGFYAAEVDYLVAHEWAVSAEDILWRRTRLGLRMPAQAVARLEAALRARRQAVAG